MIYLVTIHDKSLYGEPDVALAVVDAPDEETAYAAARPTIEQLADGGRGRCVPHARVVESGSSTGWGLWCGCRSIQTHQG